jgi:hypothetical protein
MIKNAARASRVILLFSLWMALPAAAMAADPNLREAEKHFQHGVSLYVEADYRAALVEFTRAYALAPNGIVLFNVAETQYQLRDYAAALASFEHFLAETAMNDPHRSLAESNVRELRTRVGRLRITTVPQGAEVSIDDRVIGRSPFEEPVVVSIGRMTVRAAAPGRASVVRTVDVAAEDDVAVALELPAALPVAVRNENNNTTTTAAPTVFLSEQPTSAASASHNGPAWRTAGWIATGVLAAGALTFGALAYKASRDLSDARNQYFAEPSKIQHFHDTTVRLSAIADTLTGAAIVVGGITLFSMLSARGETTSTGSVAIGPGSIGFAASF